MAEGFPLQRVAITNVILIVAFLAAGVVLSVFGHQDQANSAFATATGLAIGGASTSVVINQSLKSNGNGAPPSKSKTPDP
jgi:hypothetical protein